MANRQYKDTVFRKIFNHQREIAALYQAIRPGDTILPEDITITTLDEVFLSGQKNDLSFLWKDQAIILAEHQSTWNPNATSSSTPSAKRSYTASTTAS